MATIHQNYNYEEKGEYNYQSPSNNPFTTMEIRKGFIKKVYALLTMQLFFTMGISVIFVVSDDAKRFAVSEGGQAFLWVSFVGTMMISVGFICFPQILRKHPTNYVVLSLFTIFMSYMVGIISASYETKTLVLAFGTTGGITIALTIYATQTKYDFTTKGGMLVAGLVGILLLILINIFVQNTVLQTVIAGLGVLVFSGFIVYDTQLIVGGKHRKIQFDVDDYAIAALSLYLDVINLFLYLLQLIGGNNR